MYSSIHFLFRKGKIVMKIHVKSHNNNFPSYVQLKLYVTIFKVKLNKKIWIVLFSDKKYCKGKIISGSLILLINIIVTFGGELKKKLIHQN